MMDLPRSISVFLSISFLAAPALADDSLTVDVAGNVGVGINLPTESLHVWRDDGSAQIFVEETSISPAARTLFRLFNRGNTKFEITEGDSGNAWAFTNSGQDFRVSLQGSGTVEFRVDNSGNAFLEGVLTENSDINAKQAIVPVDPEAVLNKLTALPVSQWQYRDAPGVNHIGPMAQDFHAAFGLGADDTGIATLDSAGVTMAAIQALNHRLESRTGALARENARLRADNAQLMARLERLESRWDPAPQ